MISFKDKNFLITGAAGGIARATARLVAQHGARVALSDVNPAALAALQAELLELAPHAQISVHATDVSDAQACRATAQAVAARFGGIDHLVHAAGIYPEKLVADMSDDEWHSLMKINLDGSFYICRAVIPYLNEASSIVTLTSVAGQRGSYAHAHYAASKGALISFSRSLALELAPKTRVNALSPGIIATPMTKDLLAKNEQALLQNTPLKRLGTAEEVAGGIAFLCSPLAGFITAETLQVNGGLYIN
ncbi:SDR family NAD(P)-dependent oxidoreductase [Janthinobacterium sp. 17J80-10]|uniref:SDR family NAD(P)-dependent oxidoreductase n=1 Tax=Janthinobacterium sp. 17J80-10 TaxID=2497863 RepID=UPI00100556EF|nr:SDR family NAD(P)-dependent oxidoreductase [Janthinobacterium sp. 17J80-10]QAU32816.1 SDR family oxidoreductase [Janthinobacterium sp. 17J80-10]